MRKTSVLTRLLLIVGLVFAFSQAGWAELPTEKDVQTELDAAKADESKKSDVQNLEDTLALLSQIATQKESNKALETEINNAAKGIAEAQQALDKLKNAGEQEAPNFANLSLSELQSQLTQTQQSLQQAQTELTSINAQLVNLRSSPEQAQNALSTNLARGQEIDKLLFDTTISATTKTKLETELVLLELQNSYNQTLLKGNNALISLYSLQMEDKTLRQQQLQKKLTALQETINEKNLQETQQQAEKLSQSQSNSAADNPILSEQSRINLMISQDLVKQTAQLNTLSQDNLRVKSVLDNLQQTERNINEQISALQGTLVLSKIINKQKQLLPQDQFISGLSKQITDLRLRIFDLTELRDQLYHTSAYIGDLEKKNATRFSADEKTQLSTILQERCKLVSDTITSLNNQLNLAINIELNQQQVTAISDSLQSKLQQQSFWVRSNAPIDMDWVKSFLTNVSFELKEITAQINFTNWQENLVPAMALIMILLLIAGLIVWRKPNIKQRLSEINGKVSTLTSDSQWYTPEAVFWTIILCLPSTLIFLSTLIFITFICFETPAKYWWWSLEMAGYWLFFAFMLAMLRPNALAHRHFNMPQKNVEIFRSVLKRSVWISALWLNAGMFTYLDSGITNDVIGQVMTIFVLIVSLFIVGPRLRYAVRAYQDNQEKTGWLYKFVRMALVLVPLVLIVLIVMGYYYTTLNLMDHLMSSYFVFMAWLVFKDMIYRGFSVSSRRLAYRRLKEKREQMKNNSNQDTGNEIAIDLQQDEGLTIASVKSQVLRMVDLFLWVLLIGLFSWVWADLITVAFYLQGVTLWQQSVTTDAGVVMESITLLNLLLAIVILLVTYALVRNIAGLLEVLIFSRFNFSQGTPYTITTLLTYFIIAIGAAVAFSTLGMSWTKLQWLFAALSVGLGFGLQEIFANFVSGIIILFERPVRIGDTVTIGDYSGTVSKIRIRSTSLIDFDNKEVIVPNKAFVTERLVNWALSDSMTRVVVTIGVAYGSDVDLVKRLLLQAASESERILKSPEPAAYFLSFGASTLDHELRVYVGKLGDRTVTIDFLNRRINELFAEHHIEIAFNQLDVFIKNQVINEEVQLVSKKLN
ncbi:MAG: mechanosensitive channel MscK [[Pasteurella] aerogenes]|nr:mechanosensitive channel MscK [[Pasteurella] aerogenes]